MKDIFYSIILLLALQSCTKSKEPVEIDFFNHTKMSITLYYENGVEKEVKCFTKDGMLLQFFWENGNLKWERKFSKNTFSYYSTKGYSKSGKVLLSYSIVNGKSNGIATKYYLNGLVSAETEMKDDVKHGIDKRYFINGKLRAIAEYCYGTLIYCREFAEDSNILQEEFAMRYECNINRDEKSQLQADVNIVFGGFMYIVDDVYLSHAFYNVSKDTILLNIVRETPIYSTDTTLTYQIENNERYMCLLGYTNKNHDVEILGCIYFDVENGSIKASYCEQGITEFGVKVGSEEWESVEAYYELTGEKLPLPE